VSLFVSICGVCYEAQRAFLMSTKAGEQEEMKTLQEEEQEGVGEEETKPDGSDVAEATTEDEMPPVRKKMSLHTAIDKVYIMWRTCITFVLSPN
jgi:hypothetical protein